jgi:hypothetical protein
MTPQALDRRLNAGEPARHRIRADVPGRRGRGGTALRSISTALAEAPVVLARPGLYGPALRRRIADSLKTGGERRRLHLAVLDALTRRQPVRPLWLSVQTPRGQRRPRPTLARIRTGRGPAPVPDTGSVGHVVNLTSLLTPIYRQLLLATSRERRERLIPLLEALLSEARAPAPPLP